MTCKDKGKSLSIKEMLLAGSTPEELLKQMQDEIDSAQVEIESEKKAKQHEEDLDAIRSCVVEDMIEYAILLGVVDRKDIDDDDYENLEKALKDTEDEIKTQYKKIDHFMSFFDADEILRDFVNSL